MSGELKRAEVGGLPTDDNFVDVIFGEKEFTVAVFAEELLNAAICIDAVHGKPFALLYLHVVRIGQVVAAVGRVVAYFLGVEQRQYLTARSRLA